MGTPRETLRLERREDGAIRMLTTRTGIDHTDAMSAWARQRLTELERENLSGYVLKKDSPSCGMERVKVSGPSGLPQRNGRGIFAEALLQRFPNLPVEEEGRLSDPRLRENFIERVFAYQRLRWFFAGRWTVGGLVQFHTAHKMSLLSHSTGGLPGARPAGRVCRIRAAPGAPIGLRGGFHADLDPARDRAAARQRADRTWPGTSRSCLMFPRDRSWRLPSTSTVEVSSHSSFRSRCCATTRGGTRSHTFWAKPISSLIRGSCCYGIGCEPHYPLQQPPHGQLAKSPVIPRLNRRGIAVAEIPSGAEGCDGGV